MKKMFLTIALCAGLSLSSFADAPKSGQRHRKNIQKELNLTADQQKQMKAQNEAFRAQAKDLKTNQSLDKKDMASKMKELRAEHKAKINQILTPEQQTRFAQINEKGQKMKGNKNAGKRQGKQHARRGKGHGGNNLKDLNLTAEQKAQVKALNAEFKNKQKSLKDERSTQFMAVLTAEQKTKLETAKIEKVAKRTKVSTEGAKKIIDLRENFSKEKAAVEHSRIAPEMQKQRIDALKDKFKTERKQLKEQYKAL